MKGEQVLTRALELYADTVRRICFLRLKNHHDTQDVFQEVFLKYALREAPFENETHEKAWVIRVALNACKDVHKRVVKSRTTSLETVLWEPASLQEEHHMLLEAVLALPQKYRICIYMHYYEGYTAVEIAHILGKKENTVYTWLKRGREQLKTQLGGEYFA